MNSVIATRFAPDGASTSDRTSVARHSIDRGALVWSEYCFLLCIALALTLAVIPPDWSIPGRRLLRQLPLLATLPIAALCIVGGLLATAPSRPDRTRQSPLAAMLPLIVLAIWIVAGSAHARVVEGWHATFLTLGATLLAAPAALLVMTYSRAPTRLAQAYFRLLVCAGIAMAVGLAISYGRRDIYHEQIFLAIPLAVAWALAPQRGARMWIGSAFFLDLALLSVKNTTYLIALLTILYIAAMRWISGMGRAPSMRQLWLHYLAFVGLVAVTAAACFLIYFRDSYLPTGNVEFRQFTYRAAWQQFLASPLWGTSFSAESIREFTLYTVGIARNRLPTHSDIMDLLANGGLIAMTLWLVGYLRIGAYAYKRVLAPRFLHYPWAAQAHTFAAISLSAVVTYAFNPILLQPEMAYLVWTTLGFLVGLAASCDPEHRAGEIARRFHTAPSYEKSGICRGSLP